ncbi:MAG: 1-acyl-sn-glycerol-3-phosphate acyltransferase [Opitutales bacterium]
MDLPIPTYLPFVLALAALVRPSAEQLRRWRRRAMIATGRLLTRLVYRLHVSGAEAVPDSGAALLICNHVSYADAAVLQTGTRRPIRFLALERLYERPLLGTFLRWGETVPVSPQRATRALKEAMRYLRQGEVVCVFPEGMLSFDGRIGPFFAGYERIAKATGAPLLVAHLDGLWGSRLSFAPKNIRKPKTRRHVTLSLKLQAKQP